MVRNRYLIEVFGGVFVLSLCLIDISDIGAFAIDPVRFFAFFYWLQVSLIISDKRYYSGFRVGEKGRNLTLSNDKSPNTNKTSKKQSNKMKTPQKTFDCKTIADQLSTISLNSDNHQTCVAKLVYGIASCQLTAILNRVKIACLRTTMCSRTYGLRILTLTYRSKRKRKISEPVT